MPRHLLLVDHDPAGRKAMCERLEAAGYVVAAARTLDDARRAIGHCLPDLLLMKADLPEAGAAEMARLIGGRVGAGRTPVLLLDPNPAPNPPPMAADAVLRLPVPDVLLLARLRNILRLRDLEEELSMRASTCRDMGMAEPGREFGRQATVLLVPRKIGDGVALADALSFELPARISVLPRDQLMTRLETRGRPDVVVIDADPADLDTDLRTLPDLRCRTETRHAAILMRFPEGAEAQAAMALDLGASDVTISPDGPAMLAAIMRGHLDRAARLRALRAQVTDGLRLAVLDPLTGLYNRRYALSHLSRMAAHAAETTRPLALMMVDIDRFKRVNDTHGHQNGDRVIFAVARMLADSLRASDMIARVGGEEFLIALPDTSVREAERTAERLRCRIAAMEVALDDGSQVTVTLSIGLTVAQPTSVDPGQTVTSPHLLDHGYDTSPASALIAQADRALFAAKAHGRNFVTLARPAA